MRVALYGGSFNPPHVCHVMTVAYVLATAPVDEVWLVPVARHAFDKGRALVPYTLRHRMCELAMAPFGGRVRVSDVEQRLGGTSRTIDTVEHLLRERPELELRLVMGTDLLAERHLWKEFDRLERLAPPIVIGRQGAPAPPGYTASPALPAVASSDIRARIAQGDPPEGLLPRAVAAFIAEHGLYRGEMP